MLLIYKEDIYYKIKQISRWCGVEDQISGLYYRWVLLILYALMACININHLRQGYEIFKIYIFYALFLIRNIMLCAMKN